MPSTFQWCAGPAASLGLAPPFALPLPSRRALRDPALDCLRQAHSALVMGEPLVAMGWFEHACALRPDAVLPQLGVAICLLQAGRDDEAADRLARAYESSTVPGEVDLHLARLYLLAGHRQAAFRALAMAAEQDAGIGERLRDDRVFAQVKDHPEYLMALGVI